MEATGTGGDIRERVTEDLKLFARDAEDLLRSAGQQVDEGYRLARARFETTVSSARDGISTLEGRVAAGAREAIDATGQYVRENPWQALGAGALAGFALGLLLGRK